MTEVQLRTAVRRTPHLPPPGRPATAEALPLTAGLRALLAAECAAEAAHTGTEVSDLQQSVWVRWLEQLRAAGPPAQPARWLSAAVQAEAAAARARRELPLPAPEVAERSSAADAPWAGGTVAGGSDGCRISAVEAPLLAAERHRILTAAIARLPGRCPAVLHALLSGNDLSYPEVARGLGMSQGSVGPVRSRCLGCLRRMLPAEVADTGLGGMVR